MDESGERGGNGWRGVCEWAREVSIQGISESVAFFLGCGLVKLSIDNKEKVTIYGTYTDKTL